jgi:hypothetical protein
VPVSTVVIPEGLEPLAVWDTRTVDNPWWYCWRSAVEWARENIPDAIVVYRVEFYLLDAPFAVLHRYAVNADGRKYQDPETDSVALDEPVIVPLGELPPAHLLRTP